MVVSGRARQLSGRRVSPVWNEKDRCRKDLMSVTSSELVSVSLHFLLFSKGSV